MYNAHANTSQVFFLLIWFGKNLISSLVFGFLAATEDLVSQIEELISIKLDLEVLNWFGISVYHKVFEHRVLVPDLFFDLLIQESDSSIRIFFVLFALNIWAGRRLVFFLENICKSW